MSSLRPREKARLEKLFKMSEGYVLHFSDATIATFFYDVVDMDIHDEKYCQNGTSKAKKLREFWRVEEDHTVGLIIEAMIEEVEEKLFYFTTDAKEQKESEELIKSCREIAARLLSVNVNLNNLKGSAITFDSRHLAEQIRRIEGAVDSDPALAIGTAKELVETCCKTILEERGKPIVGTPDIPTLTKATLKELKLLPDDAHEQARGRDVIKRLLQNLGTIGNGLAELRGLYGTGHGKGGKTTSLQARHARLAVGAAATLATFLFDTHQDKQ